MGVFYLLGSTRYSSRSFYADSLGLNNNNNKSYWMTFTSCRGLTWDLGTGLSGGQKWNLSGPHDAPLITLSTELNFMHSESYQMSCDGIDVNVHLKHVICARFTSAEAGPRPNAEALTVKPNTSKNFSKCEFQNCSSEKSNRMCGCGRCVFLTECPHFKGFSQVPIWSCWGC